MASTDASPAPTASPVPRPRRRWRWILLGSALLAGGLLGCEGWARWQESAARAALADDHLDEAQRHVNLALRLRGLPATNLLAARIARRRGEYAEAEQFLGRCGPPDGMSKPVQLEWLLLRCERGEGDELAAGLLASVDNNHPESPAILEALSSVYLRQTRYLPALRCLDRWLKLSPDSVRALDWRGWVYNQLDHREQAVDDYERLLQLQPGRSVVRLRLAELLVESSRHPEAVPHLERLRAEQPDDPDVLIALASCFMVQSRTEEARALLDSALEAQPKHFGALLLRGKLEQSSEDYADAERWLRQALAQKPHDGEARYALFLCLQAQPDRQDDARAELARCEQDRKLQTRLARLIRVELDSKPKDANLAAEAGTLLLEVGEDQKGLFWLHRALALDPRHAASHRALAAYYERINNPGQATEHRQQLFGGNP
jgi:tetratricopeptide (TPR) repeat protein